MMMMFLPVLGGYGISVQNLGQVSVWFSHSEEPEEYHQEGYLRWYSFIRVSIWWEPVPLEPGYEKKINIHTQEVILITSGPVLIFKFRVAI
jgi:hypothetical protein